MVTPTREREQERGREISERRNSKPRGKTSRIETHPDKKKKRMAQAEARERGSDSAKMVIRESHSSNAPFKFNAQAAEFVPRSHAQMPNLSGYYYPCLQWFDGSSAGSDWLYFGDQMEPSSYSIPSINLMPSHCRKNGLGDDLQKKIIKQVEYLLSSMSLLSNDFIAKHVGKDPEGYVPIPIIASTKKIKSLVTNNQLLAQALRSSPNLVVSSDGKRVRRRLPFTEKEKEELQCRTVVAENLPEDHSYHNLEKIFSAAGSVRNIRICHPQESNSSRAVGDIFIRNKLHALIEYDSIETAEMAVENLNDERNWRKGLRVRLLLRRTPKSVLKSRKSEFDAILDEEEGLLYDPTDDLQPSNAELSLEANAEENSAGLKKGWPRGRGKSRGRAQTYNGHGVLAPSPQAGNTISVQSEAMAKQVSKGPRMPDGTRGFTMGRGKPIPFQNSNQPLC
ncbi:la-related protein 6C [Rhodamnia argentea]|uniref:La-related protein 6C n=1 Tax=Rhodamnia argentea TaxID=178133 RepID=A0A8B8NRJ7_9MYRT|nr:la-related protein 6C [Rhodamnia argentea]